MDLNNETTALLAKAEALGGPRISGEVKVSLAEIDQLRAEHVNAVKAYKELALHVKEVRVVIVPGDGANNKLVKDKGVRETITYRNLDDFRAIISAEESEKLKNQFDNLNRELTKAKQEVLDLMEKLADAGNTLQTTRKEHSAEVTKMKTLIKEQELLQQDTSKQLIAVKEELEKEVNEKNEALTREEKLKEQFNDVSQKLVKMQADEAVRKPWKFW